MMMRSVLKITRLALVIAGGACAILVAGSALAEIRISAARITDGQLWILGQADDPNASVTLDDGRRLRWTGAAVDLSRRAYEP